MVSSRAAFGRIALVSAVYAVAYLVAAALDLGTTAMALQRTGASEGNVFATGAAGYDAMRAWVTTLVAGFVIEGFLLIAALNAGKVAQNWLQRPVRSFGKFYVNPFARSVVDRSPLHTLAFVFAFPLLRVLAAGNNLMIWAGMTPPFGWLIGVLTHATTPAIAFWAVMGPAFYLLAFAMAPLAARAIVWLRRGADAPRAGVATA
jgi:hypothetical protein